MSTTKNWLCIVCGYVHQGEAPPDTCPVCGTGRDDFEAMAVETAPSSTTTSTTSWRCLNCQYIHSGDAPPTHCPVCHASQERFEADPGISKDLTSGSDVGRIVIIGGGIAGVAALEAIRKHAPQVDVTLISREDSLPYYRLNLTRYLAGEVTAEELPVHPADWYSDPRLNFIRNAEAREIDTETRTVRTADGRAFSYDRLILAAGAHPFLPPISGSQKQGVFCIRTKADADAVLERAIPGAQCVCIGGGILGLETAGALVNRKLNITLLEGFDWLMPRQLHVEAGNLFAESVREKGIEVITGVVVHEISGDETVRAVKLKDGREFPADLVLVTAGVRTNSWLARQAGLTVKNGVIVDDYLRTSIPEIFACGDVAEHRGICYGLWGPAYHQGIIAGMNAVGIATEFGGIPRSNTLKVLNVDLFSIGVVEAEDASYYEAAGVDENGHYARFLLRDGKLAGAILLGDATLASSAKKAVESGVSFAGKLSSSPDVEEIRKVLS